MNRRDFIRLMGQAAGLALVPAPVVAAFDPKSWPVGGYFAVSYMAMCPGVWSGSHHILASYSAAGELLKVLVDGELVKVTHAPWLMAMREGRLCFPDDLWVDLDKKKVLGPGGKYYDVVDEKPWTGPVDNGRWSGK